MSYVLCSIYVATTTWDVLVIDEAHEGIDTYRTDAAFDRIRRNFTLHLSGTPFKALAFEDGVNYTAGLPIVRTSPDHGTAYEMAGRDLADPRSMMAAIYTAIDIYNKRADYDDLVANRMTIRMPDTEIKPKGGRIIE